MGTEGTEETNLPKLAAPARRALQGAGYTRLEDLTTVTTLFGRLLDDFANALPGVSDACAPTDFPREN